MSSTTMASFKCGKIPCLKKIVLAWNCDKTSDLTYHMIAKIRALQIHVKQKITNKNTMFKSFLLISQLTIEGI